MKNVYAGMRDTTARSASQVQQMPTMQANGRSGCAPSN
jgi:hypothetical protein